MDSKVIKISEMNYRWLAEKAGALQQARGKPISFDAALDSLRQGSKVSDAAGLWKLSNKDAAALKMHLRRVWKTWTPRFA